MAPCRGHNFREVVPKGPGAEGRARRRARRRGALRAGGLTILELWRLPLASAVGDAAAPQPQDRCWERLSLSPQNYDPVIESIASQDPRNNVDLGVQRQIEPAKIRADVTQLRHRGASEAAVGLHLRGSWDATGRRPQVTARAGPMGSRTRRAWTGTGPRRTPPAPERRCPTRSLTPTGRARRSG
jgi:hypothetical protein